MAALQTSGKCSPTHVCCAFPFGLRLMHTLIFKDQICNPASAGPLILI